MKDKLSPSAHDQSLHHKNGGIEVDLTAAAEGGQEKVDTLTRLEAGDDQPFTPYRQLLPDMLCFLKCYLVNLSSD